MKDELLEIIERFGYPIYLQGSMSEDEEYPKSFFTYFNFQTEEMLEYDNDASAIYWMFVVAFYSDEPELVNTKLVELRRALKDEGWFVNGVGNDVKSDEPTHTGRALEVYKLQLI